jgi:hypothetical protein
MPQSRCNTRADSELREVRGDEDADAVQISQPPPLPVRCVRDVTGPGRTSGVLGRLVGPDPDNEHVGLCLRAIHQDADLWG